MDIEIMHVTVEDNEITLDLIVNDEPITAYYCNCCGSISLSYNVESEYVVDEYEEDIKEFVFWSMN